MSGFSEYVEATVPGLCVETKRAMGDAVGEMGWKRVPSVSVEMLGEDFPPEAGYVVSCGCSTREFRALRIRDLAEPSETMFLKGVLC